jgi:hypothetical protein
MTQGGSISARDIGPTEDAAMRRLQRHPHGQTAIHYLWTSRRAGVADRPSAAGLQNLGAPADTGPGGTPVVRFKPGSPGIIAGDMPTDNPRGKQANAQ